MPPTARKRVKHASTSSAAVPSLVDAVARLRAQLAYVDQLSSADSPAELDRELNTLADRLRTYEAAAGAGGDVDRVAVAGWSDELDHKGTQLWNRSTALKHAHLANEHVDPAWLAVVADLRLVAYRLIRLGAIEPISSSDRLSHLSLATKAAAASLAARRLSSAEAAMTECAKLVAAVEQDPTRSSDGVKPLVDYYCFRMRFSLATNKISLVSWAVSKAQALLKASSVQSRDVSRPSSLRLLLLQPAEPVSEQIEHLGHTLLEVASALLQPSASTALDGDLGSELAREWLQWAIELFEAVEGQDVRVMQICALRLFAQACLAAKDDGELAAKAEAALQQVLELDPSAALHRRVVKLVIARGGSDEEISAAFLAAAKASALESKGGMHLLAVLEQLPSPRKGLRLQLLTTTVSELATWGIVQCDFLGQVVVAAVSLASDAERSVLTQLLLTVAQGLPTFRLSPADALTCVSILRRSGDKASVDKRYADAADSFLLATSTVFRSHPFSSTAKSIRKAALCYLEAGEHERVETTMQLIPSGEEEAKDHFVRFCARLSNIAKALATLKVMVVAPGFAPKYLQWAYKLAAERDLKDLSVAITELLYDICHAPELAAQLDYMVLTRSVIRQQVVRLQDKDVSDQLKDEVAQSALKQLESGESRQNGHPSLHDLTTSSTDRSAPRSPPQGLGQPAGLARQGGRLALQDGLQPLHRVLRPLDRLDLVGLLRRHGRPHRARHRGRRRRHRHRQAVDVQDGRHRRRVRPRQGRRRAGPKKAYQIVLKHVDAFSKSLKIALASSPQLGKADHLLEAVYAVKVDALAQLEDWKALVKFVEVFEADASTAPLGVVKLVVDIVTKSSTCSLDIIRSILRKTLALLYSRQDLDVSSMALWLRMLVYELVARRDLDQALEYVQNAQQLIERHKREYPEDEASWMLSTAWDEGLNAFAASNPLSGLDWCTISLDIARAVESPLAATIEQQIDELKVRYVVKEEQDEGGSWA
ncbi:uncharacterized protein RHOBADRAFT_54798 [Rhodotorula graminis WP1]|uniref:Protein ZIP4 homolog n=1 Tax=Rhodotorula graminis (strain WP1) TaxID=578459 RepID=A0A0P9F1T0_RHOGW|nr:uncharacterized protein RHOBADRAFT_54798 [Rhodotorula graminis WP1]KPV73596.1 hypothetical protein RHOBADRAFT_54798 [Rhodotorula graminis WP1]